VLSELKYKEITGQIIGAAMKVHRYFGPGFLEVIYKRALMKELDKIQLAYGTEMEKPITYCADVIGKRRLDMIVMQTILVELKAMEWIRKKDEVQLINYLRVFDIEIGLLLNFGAASLQFRRFVNSKSSAKSN
jgi:GxxExxY protein